MNFLPRPIRTIVVAIAAAAIVLNFLCASFVIRLCLRACGWRRERIDLWSAHFLAAHSRAFCRLFRIQVRVKGNLAPLREVGSRFVVANHFGYVDVWVLSSLFPTLYVTSVEVEQTPLLGPVCTVAGCVFVERRRPTGVGEELGALQRALGSLTNLVIFPEGTSSDGSGVLPFKRSLFEAAIRANAPVQPICLRYTRINGQPVNRTTRDSVFYYGDMTFGAHFGRLLRVESIEVEVELLELIPPGHSAGRKELSETVRQRIVTAYGASPFPQVE